MDRLACLDTFVKVVDKGSFAAAARHLNLSPSTVTQCQVPPNTSPQPDRRR